MSVRRQVRPDRILGRVNATMQVRVTGLFPVGTTLGGVLTDATAPRLREASDPPEVAVIES